MDRWTSEEWGSVPEEEDREEEEELEGDWELDPNDPTHADHDLSESAGYAGWEPAPKPLFTRRGVVLLVTILVIAGLMIPVCARLL